MKQPGHQQQDQLRQQQEQMRHQQEQLRKQQMEIYYQQQKQVNEAGAISEQLNDRYAEVEAEVARLRIERDSGRLSEDQFKAKLKELMIQDEQDNWWMISAEVGNWFRYDGNNWVPAVPHSRMNRPSAVPGYPQPVVQRKGHPIRAILFLPFGLVLTFIVSWGFSRVAAAFNPIDSLFEMVGVWGILIVGAILVIRKTVKIWGG